MGNFCRRSSAADLMLLGFCSAALNMPPCVTVALTAKLVVRPDILRMVTVNYLVTRGVTVIIPSTARILAPVLELVKTTSYRYLPYLIPALLPEFRAR